jgi:endo-1,4-beta-D-glucanase Y
MMSAVQMNMQAEFDKLWRFAQQRMQLATNAAGLSDPSYTPEHGLGGPTDFGSRRHA